MKKKVVSLLVAAMTVASLTACGNSGSDAPAANPAPAPAESEPAPAPEPAESEAPAPAESGAESEAPAPAADGEVISVGLHRLVMSLTGVQQTLRIIRILSARQTAMNYPL